MKINRTLWTSFLIGMTFLISCNKVDLKDEERQIRELWAQAGDYVCNGDWENYAECWDHSSKIQIMHTDQGEWLTGWEKIGKKYETMLNSGMRCSIPKNELTLNISSSGEMAWGTVDIVIQFNDSSQTQVHLWETGVFEKINGKWKIVHGMVSMPKNVKE